MLILLAVSVDREGAAASARAARLSEWKDNRCQLTVRSGSRRYAQVSGVMVSTLSEVEECWREGGARGFDGVEGYSRGT